MQADKLRSEGKDDRWSLRQRQAHMENLRKVVREAGQKIMAFAETVKDTESLHGHASSTIDSYAQVIMTGSFQEVYERTRVGLDKWFINLDYEDAIASVGAFGFFPSETQKASCPVAIIDEIDGTTNVKRAVAAPWLSAKNPKSAVCVALKRNRASAAIECGAVYAIDEDCVFTGMAAEGAYIAFRDRACIGVNEAVDVLGDSKWRVIVPCYSNEHRTTRAQLEEAIEGKVNKGQCESYGGCRSSTIDVIDIIRNQYDAYVDCRALWTKDLDKNAVLRVYDVAAVMPIARGAGLSVVTPTGEDFSLANVEGRDPLSVIIGRPSVVQQIVQQIGPFVKKLAAATSGRSSARARPKRRIRGK